MSALNLWKKKQKRNVEEVASPAAIIDCVVCIPAHLKIPILDREHWLGKVPPHCCPEPSSHVQRDSGLPPSGVEAPRPAFCSRRTFLRHGAPNNEGKEQVAAMSAAGAVLPAGRARARPRACALRCPGTASALGGGYVKRPSLHIHIFNYGYLLVLREWRLS